MNTKPWFWGLHAQPPTWLRIVLMVLPFVVLLGIYMVASHIRHAENPNDKLLPTLSQIGKAAERMALNRDARTGNILLWSDTLVSVKRIAAGVLAAALAGLILGLNMGMLPGVRHLGLTFITFIAHIPPLAILPILFISFGVDEFGKIALIFLGTFPLITRDVYFAVSKIPPEMIVKALTLGASQWGVAYRVIFPQVLPRLIETVRLCLGAAWLFLIAAEAIASQDGLGYRIFLVRRYLSMDVIILYVAWITVLAASVDLLLKLVVSRWFPWYHPEPK